MHASTGSLRTRSFGVFEVDLRAAELRKFGIKIKLQEQPFQLLALLRQIELNSRNQSSGRAHLATLRKQADRRGFQLVTRKAAAALHVAHDQASGQRPSQNKNRGLSRSTRA